MNSMVCLEYTDNLRPQSFQVGAVYGAHFGQLVHPSRPIRILMIDRIPWQVRLTFNHAAATSTHRLRPRTGRVIRPRTPWPMGRLEPAGRTGRLTVY